jgi:hypothetical protein
MKTAASIVCVVGLASAAVAVPVVPKTYTGQGGALADSPTDGVPGVSMFSINVPSDPDDTNEIFGFVDVRLDINHTWVGDLVVRLRHDETGTFATLIDRPGVPPGVVGNSDDLAGVYIFEDGQTPIPENGGMGTITPGVYGPSGPGFLFFFEGESKVGTWTLIIEDHANGDTGTLNSWGFTINNVPAPGAAGVLALAGLAAARRRR